MPLSWMESSEGPRVGAVCRPPDPGRNDSCFLEMDATCNPLGVVRDQLCGAAETGSLSQGRDRQGGRQRRPASWEGRTFGVGYGLRKQTSVFFPLPTNDLAAVRDDDGTRSQSCTSTYTTPACAWPANTAPLPPTNQTRFEPTASTNIRWTDLTTIWAKTKALQPLDLGRLR